MSLDLFKQAFASDNHNYDITRALMDEAKREWEVEKAKRLGIFSPSAGFDRRLVPKLKDKAILEMGSSCALKAYAQLTGIEQEEPKDLDMWELALVGKVLHKVYQGIWEAAGLLTDIEKKVIIFTKYPVEGSIDGIWTKKDKPIIDLKITGSHVFDNILRSGSSPAYNKPQMQLYLKGTKKKRGEVCYVNRGEPFKKNFISVDFDPNIIKVMEQYYSVLTRWKEKGLPKEAYGFRDKKWSRVHCNPSRCNVTNWCKGI